MELWHSFNVIRRSIPLPKQNEDVLQIEDDLRLMTGEDTPWGLAIPSACRLLANPTSPQVIPKPPAAGGKFADAVAYWSALLHLLIYPFGWTRPDRGLRWWYQSGFPTDDPVLALIEQVWHRDGQLDWFAAWLWSSGGLLLNYHPFSTLDGIEVNTEPIDVDQGWVDTTLGEATRAGVEHPLHGGNDGFHLSAHVDGPVSSCNGGPIVLRSTSDAGATLLAPEALGWYRALADLQELTSEEAPTHVDVVVKPIGHLGTYRRSPTTGLWYRGEHDIHLRGV